MDRSVPRPTGLQGSPRASPPGGDATDSGPLLGGANDVPRRSRVGISRFAMWTRGRIGALLLGLIVLSCLPLFGPPGDATLARRIPGAGDTAILTFAFAPAGATIASIQTDGRVTLRDAGSGVSDHSFLDYPSFALALAFAPDGRSLAVGSAEPDILVYDIGAGGTGRPLGMPGGYGKDLVFSPDGRLLAASS